MFQSSSSSKAHSKRVMYQTVFDVPDPLVVHVLLLTHEFYVYNTCLPHPGIFSVTVHVFMRPKHTDDDSPSLIKCGRLVLADA